MCARVRAKGDAVSLAEMSALVIACATAITAPEVADAFLSTVASICDYTNSSSEANIAICGPAAAIQAASGAVSIHAAGNVSLALKGCEALANLVGSDARGNDRSADAFVSTSGGLEAIVLAMGSHPDNADVQKIAAKAVKRAVSAVSYAGGDVMRATKAGELMKARECLLAAMTNHSTDEYLLDAAGRASRAIQKALSDRS